MSRLLEAHLPCDNCGSSDALSVFENGTHCYSCKHTVRNKSQRVKLNVGPVPEVPLMLPDDFTLDIPEVGLQWLQKVQINTALCAEYRIGYSPQWLRIIIPAFHEDEFLGWQARAIYTSQNPKYIQAKRQKPILFYNHVRPHPWVVLTEDAASAIRLGGLGFPAISLLGSSLDGDGRQLKMLLEASQHFILWFDSDKAGLDATKKIQKRLDTCADVLHTITTKEDIKYLTDGQINEQLRCVLS